MVPQAIMFVTAVLTGMENSRNKRSKNRRKGLPAPGLRPIILINAQPPRPNTQTNADL